MAFQFFVHNNLTFGKDAIQSLSGIIENLGLKKVMLVHDPGVKFAGIPEKVMAELNKVDGLEVTVFGDVEPNPSNELIEKMYAIAKDAQVQGFVAVGGGSSIDATKAVNVLMTNPGPIGQYGGIGLVKNPVLPLIAIPTTAGTSSEITNVSALTDTVKVVKYVVIDDKMVPSQVICDPEFTRTVPKGVTAATGMDAMTHAIESYISNASNRLTRYHAVEALKIFFNALPKAVEDGNDMQAREDMMLGCIIVGYSFSNANLGLVHAIAHTLSARNHLAHGVANATVLPYVMRFNAPSCPDEMIELAKAVNLPLTGDKDKDMYALSDALLDLKNTVGIKTLSELGVTEEDFDVIAENALLEVPLMFNPRQGVTKEDIIEILKKAF